MTAANYKNAYELIVTADETKSFDAGVRDIKSTILAHGFSQAAADSLSFSLKKYLLTVDRDEASTGAFHVYADNKPFYEMQITAPGSMFDMLASDASIPPNKADDKSQALLLYFEIAMNLMNKVPQLLVDPSQAHAGGSFGMHEAKADTVFRVSPTEYLHALNRLVDYRLEMIAPRTATPAPAAAPSVKPPKL